MKDTVIHKSLEALAAAGDAGPPGGGVDEEAARDLTLINARFALVSLAPDEVDLRRMRLANDRVDRTYERFSPAFLARLAATIIGKSVLVHHDKHAFPIGRFYAAEVILESAARRGDADARGFCKHGDTETRRNVHGEERDETGVESPVSTPFSVCSSVPPCLRVSKTVMPPGPLGEAASPTTHWLIARYYMLRSEATAELRRQIDAGVYSFVSIGFRGGAPRCDLCGAPFAGECPHWPGRVYATPAGDRVCTLTWEDPDGSAEAVEGSLVWLGAQIGAQHVKSWREGFANTETRRHGEEHTENDRTQEQAGPPQRSSPCSSPCLRVSVVKELRKEALMENERIAQLEREVAEYRERAAETARLEPLARDGERYRADLVAEITRLAGLVGAAKEAAFLCESLTAAGAERLKELKAEYERRVEEKLPPQGCGRPADDPRPLATRDTRAHSVI